MHVERHQSFWEATEIREGWKIVETHSPDGYFPKRHIDRAVVKSVNNHTSVFTVLAYLNGDFEGGELEIMTSPPVAYS